MHARSLRRTSALALLLLGLGLPGTAAAEASLRIAVLEFTNASTDPSFEPLGKGLQSMLTTDLAAVEAVQLVERARLAEIRGEIDLGRSGAVDLETAVQFGRLAGASHLLAGSFTVVGASMRLDARLFDVADGSIQLAQEITGETEAFFELEKELVGDLIKSLGLELQARERAAVARIHTADFEAFTSFSRGIDLFDQENYDAALTSLRDATTRDEDFKLARLTLQEYEGILATLRARRDDLAAARDELRRLERLQEAEEEARVVTRLLGIAGRQGQEAQAERLTALYLLAVAYGNIGTDKSKLMRLRQREDRWAMERTSDALVRSYWTEALPLWPALPLVVDQDFYRGLPSEADFDEDFARAVRYLYEKGHEHPDNRRNYLTSPLRYPWKMAARLHLDAAGALALRQTFYESAKELHPSDYWLTEHHEAFIQEYRELLMLDESTAMALMLSSGEDRAGAVGALAKKIERNRDVQAALEESANRELMEEWFLLAFRSSWSFGPILRFAREHFMEASPDAEGWGRLNRLRAKGIGDDEYILLGGHPLWALQGRGPLRTGHRSDPLRSESLRYYSDAEEERAPSIAILDGVPSRELDVSFSAGFERARDWFHIRQGDYDSGKSSEPPWSSERPLLGFVFGARDLRVERVKDEDGEYQLTRPMTGWMVALAHKEVQLVRFRETERGNYDRKQAFSWEVLERSAVKWPKKGRATISIRLAGESLVVSAGGQKHRFEAPAERSGFHGFAIRGSGYVDIEDLKLEVR